MPTPDRLEKITRVAGMRQQGIVIIEDVYDPHNAEAVIRSCDGFGIQEVWFIFDTQPKFNPARVGKASSSSANKWLDFKTFTSAEESITTAQKQGYEVVATVLDDTSESLYEAKFTNPKTALLLGNEKEGLSEKAASLADRKIIIPMRGLVQSFNLSVTASIFLFELTRQRMEKGMGEFALPQQSVSDLIEDFSNR